MGDMLNNLVISLKNFVLSSGPVLSLVMGSGLIILESIIPALPLALFIALNIIIFGNIVGFIISWISTVIGCMLSFYIFRKGFHIVLYKHFNKSVKLQKFIDKVSNISFSSLVIIAAMPFTPAFTVNIAGGISNIKTKKFFLAILIGKLSIVYFWGYIGTTFIESIQEPIIMIKIILMILGAFIVSKYISKKFSIE